MQTCPVDTAIWIITGVCNLNCLHCYAYRWRGRRELSLEEKMRLVREFSECEIEYVNISGGEPLLHPHTRQVLEGLREAGIETSIVTNGTMINDEWSRLLAKLEVFVFVSLDGPKDVHEMQRGPGTYDRVIKGIERLKKHGVPYALVMAVSKLNWRYTSEFVELAVKLGAERPILIPVMPFGRALENRIYVSTWEYNRAVINAARKARELGVKLQLWCSPFAFMTVPPVNHDDIVVSYCRLAPVVDIDPQGNVLLCDVMDIVLGSVRGKPLREVIEMVERHPLVGEVFEPKGLPEACKKCPYVKLCRGGCFTRALVLRGSLNAGDPLCPRVALHAR
ncbi:Radical SAM domain protein [Pyrolobus fumarii 1A]|uniref:Radical SAM domain protein n=1 Tax=Pyrolobus fumarii (strain DSM 11204 / 1A) TaxID=694429 RepID=G0ECC1_PYRF1|nr:radical SAM protein [Pyrolobus fumarii]AEM39491.1 Radical SAM domain protein [Pyrolobus fumarii 1A]